MLKSGVLKDHCFWKDRVPNQLLKSICANTTRVLSLQSSSFNDIYSITINMTETYYHSTPYTQQLWYLFSCLPLLL